MRRRELFLFFCLLLFSVELHAAPRLRIVSSEQGATLQFQLFRSVNASSCSLILFGSQKRRQLTRKQIPSSANLYSISSDEVSLSGIVLEASELEQIRGRKGQRRRALFFRLREQCEGSRRATRIRRVRLRTSAKRASGVSSSRFLQNISDQLPLSEVALEDAFPNITFTTPVDIRNAGDGTDRLFIVEQTGLIKVVENSSSASSTETFLDLTADTVLGGERGVFSIAFHPNFASNGFAFVHYTDTDGDTVIERFTVSPDNPNQLDITTRTEILSLEQPSQNHNGGSILFGSDGLLYVTLGDGSLADDANLSAQNRENLFGSILRLDVDSGAPYTIPSDNPFVGEGGGVREEIYAFGLRNPWRASFDSLTGELWVGDVGQATIEEINIIESGGDYGWSEVEGDRCFREGCKLDAYSAPIYTYTRTFGRSVTGGYVYRGSDIPSLYGKYVFGDFISGVIQVFTRSGDSGTGAILVDSEDFIATFGEDEAGELYYGSYIDGKIYKFRPRELAR